MDQKLEQGKLKEFVMSSLMDPTIGLGEHGIIHGDVSDGSERDVCQVRIQEKVETIWLLDTRAEQTHM